MPPKQIVITLDAGQWNAVLSALAKQPYEFSAPLIEAIRMQAMAQERIASPEQLNGAEPPAPAAN
jgi:hypothetical protein